MRILGGMFSNPKILSDAVAFVGQHGFTCTHIGSTLFIAVPYSGVSAQDEGGWLIESATTWFEMLTALGY